MRKLIIGTLATVVMATAAMATDKYTGAITYVQVRSDGQIAVKVLPNGATTEIYGTMSNNTATHGGPEKMKAMYAMALTALSTGKDVEMWKEGAYWDTIFLRK